MTVLDDIYDAIDDEQAFARLPAALAVDLGARSCMIQIVGPDGQLREHVFSYWTQDQFSYFADNDLFGIDEWRNFALTPRFAGQAFRYDDHVSTAQFLDSPLYNDFFRIFGDDTARFMGAMMPARDQTLLIGLHRPARDSPFDDGQLAHLEGLTHHLRRLASARAALTCGRQVVDHLAAALDAPQVGIMRVDADGRLIHANAAGQEILDAQDGFALVGSLLSISSPRLQERFSHAIRTAARRSAGQGDALLAPRPSGEPPWRVMIVPDEAGASGSATVLVEAPGANRVQRAYLALLYDLTPAETEVASLLAQGLSTTEIAERRGASIHTVRTQAKAVLSKTGASRQAELAALLAGVSSPSKGR